MLKNMIRRWLGIESDWNPNLEDRRNMMERIDKLEQRWVAEGPGKIDVATTRGTKKALAPTYHSAQSLLDLINKRKK